MQTRRIFTIILLILLIALSLAFTGKDVCAETKEKYTRTIVNYVPPEVMLVNQDGVKVKFSKLLNSKKVVMVDFIFTTCTTICPVLSASFANFQRRIGPGSKDVHLVSISIDPENDTPKRMREYLKRYDAKPGWDFLTGSKTDIEKVVKALDAYTPSKMSHLPLALLYASTNNRWVRIYGLIGTSDLMAEYEKALRL
ncbi:MAG: SCO family protein [Thermodesulfovibrionales bacterium]